MEWVVDLTHSFFLIMQISTNNRRLPDHLPIEDS